MKRKRICACILSACLIFQMTGITVLADNENKVPGQEDIIQEQTEVQKENQEIQPEDKTGGEEKKQPGEEVQEEEKQIQKDQINNTAKSVDNQPAEISEYNEKTNEINNEIKPGSLEAVLSLTLPYGNKTFENNNLNVKVSIGESELDTFFKKMEGEPQKLYASIKDLTPGTYHVTISGDRFASYEQDVEVIQGMNQRIELLDNYKGADITSMGEMHPGVIGYGNVNSDGQITASDKEELITAIESGNSSSLYDLNGDGAVSLLDLQYFSYSYGFDPVLSSVSRTYITDNIVPQVENGTVTEGTIDDILTGQGTVSVGTANNEEISKDNPVEVSLDLNKRDDIKTSGFTIQPPKDTDNAIKDGEINVEYVDENGDPQQVTCTIDNRQKYYRSRAAVRAQVTVESDGTIVVNLGAQIAVKKITIKITETGSNKLADISKVEFLNNMEERIPAPEMNIPDNVKTEPGNKQFTVTWNNQTNVAGYEVQVTYEKENYVFPSQQNSLLVKSLGDKKLENLETYEVRVRSVNGEWKSPYSEAVTAVPQPSQAPDPPENVAVQSAYRRLDISWKKMKDTDYYTLYYREKGSKEFRQIDQIKANSYQLMELKDNTEYEICLSGTNIKGTGKKSQTYIGKTVDINPAITSNYKLINTSNGSGYATAHIEKVEYSSGIGKDYQVADDDYTTSWVLNNWDGGGFNKGKPSPIITFDKAYEMDRIVIIPDEFQTYDYFYTKTQIWDESGNAQLIDGHCTKKTSSNGKLYYEINLDSPVKVKKIQVNFALYLAYGDGRISIAEMKFYYYDDLEAQTDALFKDDMHVELAEGVTGEQIDGLIKRANTKDEVSGEYHPRKERILTELEYAKQLFEDKKAASPVIIDPTVTKAKDGATSISGGLNAWQPLGVTVHEGEEIVVYAGRKGTQTGGNTAMRLIATQYHAESGSWQKNVVGNLKAGRNVVTIPKITSLGVEHGGSLYVEFTGNNDALDLSIRVSGGQKIPVLNVSKIQDDGEKRKAVQAYIEELNESVPQLEEKHNELHKGNAESRCDYDYSKENCILGATEIVLDQMMYSVSSRQILEGINSKLKSQGKDINTANQTEVLYQSLEAMDQMIELFYQHKGFDSYNTSDREVYKDRNNLPVSRLNIRYMRMFAGAFMYAGGLHIGIEWGSIPGLAKAVPVQSDNGKYVSGQLFGWGIAHEIGHIINQPNYAIAEITNNYFSILAQADETNEKVRFKYPDVYEKVTSGVKGRSSSVFTSLAMYWQLHLAYDNGYNYKTYDNYNDQFNNIFFARVDAYARNTAIAPQPAGIALTLTGDVDNKLMRLSCAAAQKNLLEFFERWGMTPDKDTIAYAGQFDKEERDICYITDEARDYRIQGNEGMGNASVQASLEHEKNTKQVTLHITNNAADQNAMLGYEILRNGTVVGFVSAEAGETQFTDTISAVNNRVFTYEVAGYDKLLNRTDTVSLDPVKISHDGSIGKENWTVTTNMTSEDDKREEAGEYNPEPQIVSGITKIHDDDYKNTYTGTFNSPQIIVEFGETLPVSAVKVTAEDQASAPKKYEVYVSSDGGNWTPAGQGTFTYQDNTATAYFNKEGDTWLYTYDASHLKLVIKGQTKVSISELDVLAPSGDNVELVENGIGILQSDYVYSSAGDTIPAGSLIFTGEYKGNPAYNAVKLYDQSGNIIEGTQIIFADVPEKGELGEISSGTWIYYVEPGQKDILLENLTGVRAELYRVDDAHTNEGERLVSDTLLTAVPKELPDITLKGNQ